MEFIPISDSTERKKNKFAGKKSISNNRYQKKLRTNKDEARKSVKLGSKSEEKSDDDPIFSASDDVERKEKDAVSDEDNSESDNNIKEANESEKQKKDTSNELFIMIHKKVVNDSFIKELHPDIIKVKWPRQRKPKFCFAVFDSSEKALSAFKDLRKKREKGFFVSLRRPVDEEKRSKHLLKKKLKKPTKIDVRSTWLV